MSETMAIPQYGMATAPQFVGRELGASDWVAVDQDLIDRFAACTGDRQWIHVDVERARRESPFGGPIAHGYLSLSLVAAMVMELGVIPADAATGLNYGLDKVRFIAPVKAGARVRARASLIAADATERRAGAAQAQLRAGDRRRDQARPGRRAPVHADRQARGFGMNSARASMANEADEAADHDIRQQAAQHTLAANPLVGVRGQDILDSAGLLLGRMLGSPAVVAQQYLSFLAELGRIVTGGSELAPDAKDRRFADPAWKENPAYRALVQGYLAWSNALHRFVDEARFDQRDAERARFVVSLVVDAMSPPNSLAGNPAAMKKLVDTGGTSLVHGLENFIGDLVGNGGLPAQVDTRSFAVGRNLATTPGSVVIAPR